MHIGTIDAVPRDGTTEIRLTGDIDGTLRDGASRALGRALTGGRPVVVDLSGVTFIDTAGVAFLIQCARACAQCRLTCELRDPPPTLVRTLRALGLEHLLPAGAAADPAVAAR